MLGSLKFNIFMKKKKFKVILRKESVLAIDFGVNNLMILVMRGSE